MIHPSADISPSAMIGQGTHIWHQAQVREHAQLGRNCIVGKGAYIDSGVTIGDNVKIQNGAFIYHGVTIEDGVFIGPRACFTNDMFPRAITVEGALKTDADWQVCTTLVRYGASIGAGAVVLPDLIIGRFALVGAGAVVTRSVPDYGLVVGNPARLIGFACRCGQRLPERERHGDLLLLDCPACQSHYELETPGDTRF
jgi:UDP-2-acetamido-3-amino-2,3-dideoxy-glucuronate N-acetyltransferase